VPVFSLRVKAWRSLQAMEGHACKSLSACIYYGLEGAAPADLSFFKKMGTCDCGGFDAQFAISGDVLCEWPSGSKLSRYRVSM